MNNDIKRRILQLFYPSRCPMCNEVIYHNDRFCTECRSRLIDYTGSFTIKGADSFTAVFVYDENVLPAIALLKDGICGNADFALGGELADKLRDLGMGEKIDLIIPVPMYSSKKAKRSYNQSELLARIVSRTIGVPFSADAVVKSRDTAEQKELNRMRRMMNLKKAFTVCLPELVSGKRVLIIDDICTTGSTLAELTAVIRNSGAAAVHCAVCCKTPLKQKKQ